MTDDFGLISIHSLKPLNFEGWRIARGGGFH